MLCKRGSYRTEMDPTREWLNSNYAVKIGKEFETEQYFVAISVLWSNYQEFLRERSLLKNVDIPTTQNALSRYLDKRVKLTKRNEPNKPRGYYGLKARSE